MKVFYVEFTFFNGVYWGNVDYKITATSKEELKKATMKKLEYMSERNLTPEEKWKEIEKILKKKN